MSICPQAMSWARPSSAVERVSPVTACFEAVYAADSGLRLLLLHQPERVLRAEERPGQVGLDHGPPGLGVEVLERDGRRVDAGVVEQEIEAAKAILDLAEERGDRLRVADIRRDRDRSVPRLRGGRFQRVETPAG